MTYSRSGFELKNTSGRHATRWPSKIEDLRIHYHRDIPVEVSIKEASMKKEPTGEWFASFGLETDDTDILKKPVLALCLPKQVESKMDRSWVDQREETLSDPYLPVASSPVFKHLWRREQ